MKKLIEKIKRCRDKAKTAFENTENIHFEGQMAAFTKSIIFLEDEQKRLRKWVKEGQDYERNEMKETAKIAGVNCVDYGMASGASEVYEELLEQIGGGEDD